MEISETSIAKSDFSFAEIHKQPDSANEKPMTLQHLPQAMRDHVIVSTISDDKGIEHTVSLFRDSHWNFASDIEAKNITNSKKTIYWDNRIPILLLNDAKAVIYHLLRNGRNGRRMKANNIRNIAQDAMPTLFYFSTLGIKCFSDLTRLHLTDYIADLRAKVGTSTIKGKLYLISLAWEFSSQLFHPLKEHPWHQKSFHKLINTWEDGEPSARTGRTPVIPRSVQKSLFAFSEALLSTADATLKLRNSGRLTPSAEKLTAIRDAVLYLIQITSGMRNSETIGIRRDCWRKEIIRGTPYHWIGTREIKTNKGDVEFLVPPEAIQALEFLQKYAEPFRARLIDECSWLQSQIDGRDGTSPLLKNGRTLVSVIERLNYAREIQDNLFLTLSKQDGDHLGIGTRVEIMNANTCVAQLRALSRKAGVEWNLANHQCRRTFAFNVANSRLGRMGLTFTKWQLKHGSVSWSELYASNPRQDQSLYNELADELIEARADLFEGWFDSTEPLSGGAGEKLMRTRGTAVRNRRELLTLSASSIDVLSTGHGWCLSGLRDCNSQGLFDPSMCGPCSRSVIERTDAHTWQMIHMDNIELAALDDCGSGIKQKSERAVKRSEKVLKDLQVSIPTHYDLQAYRLKAGASRTNS